MPRLPPFTRPLLMKSEQAVPRSISVDGRWMSVFESSRVMSCRVRSIYAQEREHVENR